MVHTFTAAMRGTGRFSDCQFDFSLQGGPDLPGHRTDDHHRLLLSTLAAVGELMPGEHSRSDAIRNVASQRIQTYSRDGPEPLPCSWRAPSAQHGSVTALTVPLWSRVCCLGATIPA
jgi:hypothetical protein